MKQKKPGFETIALHAGHKPDSASLSRAVPIYQTTSYVFRNTAHAARLFSLKEKGNTYTRIANPTCEVLEHRVAALEGGAGALAAASGMAAETVAVLNIAGKGDHIVSSSSLYGGTYTLFRYTLARMGIDVTFVDSQDPESFRRAIRPNTKLLYAEILGNPRVDVLDIAGVAKAAHSAGVPLFVDNTVPTPYLCRPIEWGADIVVHSLTKWLGGHGNSIGGIIVDSGRFDWAGQGKGKFPTLTEPDPAYHGLNFSREFKELAFITRARLQVLRDLGPALSPFNAFLILQGIETLALRMLRHSENALSVARFLERHKAVAWVNYPGLKSHPGYGKARKYLPRGAGSLLGFGIKGGKRAGAKFIDSVKLLSHLANIGDAKSLVIHPASTTHQQLSAGERARSGVTEDFIRLSVGIEDIADIIADISSALAASQSGRRKKHPGR